MSNAGWHDLGKMAQQGADKMSEVSLLLAKMKEIVEGPGSRRMNPDVKEQTIRFLAELMQDARQLELALMTQFTEPFGGTGDE